MTLFRGKNGRSRDEAEGIRRIRTYRSISNKRLRYTPPKGNSCSQLRSLSQDLKRETDITSRCGGLSRQATRNDLQRTSTCVRCAAPLSGAKPYDKRLAVTVSLLSSEDLSMPC